MGVAPFEVEGGGQRRAHAGIAEDRAARVVDPALHAGRDLVGDRFLADAPVPDRRHVVRRGPVFRRVLRTEVVGTGLERFQRHDVVAIVVVANRVEVVAPHVHGQRGRPVILHAAIGDRAAGLQRLHAIGPAAERRLQRRLREIMTRPIRLREHRQLADDDRQLAVLVALERELHRARPGLRDARHLRVVRPVERMPARLQRVERPDHVLDGHGAAVVKARRRAQREGDPGAIRRRFDRLGHETVLRRRLVGRRHRERVERVADTGCRHALEDERVEVVERADRPERHAPTLGCARIDVPEVRKAGAVLQVPVDGEPVSRMDRRRRARPGGSGGDSQSHGEDNGERSHADDSRGARQPLSPSRRPVSAAKRSSAVTSMSGRGRRINRSTPAAA